MRAISLKRPVGFEENAYSLLQLDRSERSPIINRSVTS
jgi:hypothetical protein